MNDKQKYIDCLSAVKEVLDKHDIEYWLDYGTLWGYVRDNAIMEFDTDVDFGVWLEDVPKLSQTKKDFRELGYDLRINPDHLNYVIHDLKTGEHLGCLLFRKMVWSYAIRIHFKPWCKILRFSNIGSGGVIIKNIWKFIIFAHCFNVMKAEVSGKWEHMNGFKIIKFYGKEHKIPEKPKEYLDWMYCNRDWRIKSDRALHGDEIGRRRQSLKEVEKNERGRDLEN